jgi:hypothetical protein
MVSSRYGQNAELHVLRFSMSPTNLIYWPALALSWRISFITGWRTTKARITPGLSAVRPSAVPCPPGHSELEPGFPGLDGSGAVLDPRTALGDSKRRA